MYSGTYSFYSFSVYNVCAWSHGKMRTHSTSTCFTGSVIKWNLLYKCCMYNGPNIPLFYEKFVWNCRCALFYWVHYKNEFYCINVALITDPILITIFHEICWHKYRTQKMFQKLVTTYLFPGNVCVHYFALLPDNTYFSLRCLL